MYSDETKFTTPSLGLNVYYNEAIFVDLELFGQLFRSGTELIDNVLDVVRSGIAPTPVKK